MTLDHIPIVTLLGTILLLVVSRFLVQFYRARATFANLKSQGLVCYVDRTHGDLAAHMY